MMTKCLEGFSKNIILSSGVLNTFTCSSKYLILYKNVVSDQVYQCSNIFDVLLCSTAGNVKWIKIEFD